ncbi:MAG TPA: PKD domain-containing protein [Puia sp.]|nr:PKD domain-containing protein [Puia sp.]
MNRKLFILAGCFCLLGILVRAQAPVAQFTSNVTSGCAPLGIKFTDQSTNNPTSWEWSFGNGQTSSQQNPTVVYTQPGTYTITLIVKNASGAAAVRDSNYITIYASPTVSFGLNHLACAPADIQFQQYSQPGQGTITSYVWNFGDGTSGNGPTPQHLYTQTGYYSVTLTVTNSGGCSNSATYTRTLRLVDGVQPNFTWNETGNTCTAPFTLNFLNQTAGPGTMTYNWSLGAGAAPATSTATNPAGITYPSAGSYSVTLIATSNLGCADTLTQTVPLASNTPVITAPTAGCLNSPVNFSNGTTPAPISSLWDFGDGSPTSNQAAPTHTYTSAGTFTVTLTNKYANCTTTATSNITIGAALVPTFTAAPTSACQAPLAVQFTDQTSPVPTQWTWDFGDGTPTSNQQSPLHTYTSTGNFNVMLTATTAAGCSGTTTMSKEVNITAPTITLAGQGACVNTAFTPSYTVNSVDPVTSYTWSAPNATPSTATGASPSFTYSATGFYTITLTIQTVSGCSATQTFTNAIQVGTPTPASFTATPNPACGANPVSFSSPSTPADEWYWNFGDGAPLDSGQNVTHQFLKFGTETVTLSVSHAGCVTQATNFVTVTPPIPNFGYVVNCANNNPLIANNMVVSFLDSSLTKASFGPISYDWSFGDGSPDYITSTPPYLPPPHTYPGPNTYLVTLHITNGCTSFASKQITLENINASFTVSQNPVCNQQTFVLQSTSTTMPTGTPNTGYIWAFGPGDSVHQSSTYPTHITGVGTYPTTLTVIDQNGCRYTSLPTNITVTAPTAKFTAPPGGCVNSTITFTDNSTPSALASNITGWIWNFGDNTGNHNSGTAPFTYQFADTGSYTVIEIVTDAAGCVGSDTVQAAVQITSPHALFILPDSFYCPNTIANFTDLSIGYGLTWSWNFGDGTGPGYSTAQNPQHTFPAATGVTYPVTETVIDKFGCTTDTTENIQIYSPIAAFTIADTTSICIPLQTMFTSTSQWYDSLYWEFGDGQTSTLAPSTSHFYNSLDTFTATLVVQGPGGCLDSTSRKVFLTNPGTTVFTFTPKTACDSVVAQFNIVPPPYTTFTLQFGDNTADSSQNDTPIHTYRSPNTFVPLLYLTDATGCIVTESDTLLTVLGAVPFFTATPTAFCDSGTVSFTDYTITNNGVQSKTFTWGDNTPPGVEGPPQTAPFNTTHYYGTPGTMLATLTVVTLSNCTASYIDTIRVYQTPKPLISDSGYLCAGLIQFLGKLAVPDADTIFWQWNFGNGQTSNVQNPLVQAAAGTYNVTLKASVSIGCADTTSATLTVNPNPTIKGPRKISTPVGVPVTIPFTYSPDVTTWAWQPAANLSCTDCANPSATLTFAQTYSVLVTDSNNCTDTASILINTICDEGNYFFPNTFSPNGDGVNDYFYPRGSGLYNIQSLTIFNRWGQIVFQRKNFPANSETMGWDGTFNGNPAPMDAYVYIAEVICNNAQVVAIHGNVTLVR